MTQLTPINFPVSIFILLLAFASSGCSTVRYLTQATRGQLALINRAKPISEVVKDERTPPRTRDLLNEIEKIKGYGETKGIKRTSNYQDYVQLDRPAAVWVVSACEKLQFKSKEWNFPIVGRFPYLGWFDLDGAKEFAATLREENLDVDVRGAAAYSTLGWFRDAVLSTMLPDDPDVRDALGGLVNVVIHESVHATIYISGQAYFNESVASFAADHLTGDYLDQKAGSSPSPARLTYEKSEKEGEARAAKLHDAYNKLAELYASSKSDSQKVEEKTLLLKALKQELGFKREINNATLIQFKAYHTGGDDFEGLWKACGGDAQRFMRAVTQVTDSSFQKSQQEDLKPVLAALSSGC